MDEDRAEVISAAVGRRQVWIWCLPALLLLPFLFWPLGSMLWRGVAPEGALSSQPIRQVMGDSYYWERLGFTAMQASMSTVFALLVGLPAAYVFALIRFPARSLFRALVTVPFVMPTLVVALAFKQLVGSEGWLNDMLGLIRLGPINVMGTLWLILAAHVFYNVAIVIRIVSTVWANVDPRLEEAARLLGAGRVATFRSVTLPALLPAIASSAALVFTFAFTSFGVVLILGGTGLDTLEVSIYRLATRLVELPAAAILSLVQLLATLTALTMYSVLQRRTSSTQSLRADRARSLRQISWLERILLLSVLTVLGALVLAPVSALVHGALTTGADGGVTAANFAYLFEDTGRASYVGTIDAVRWSLSFALGSTVVALIVGSAAAVLIARSSGIWGSLMDGALMLPLAVPAVVLGFGYLTTFNRDPYDLRGSAWLVLAAHSLIAYPFVLRSVLALLRTLDPHLSDAARTLGASPWKVWRFVELPISTRALLVGAVFSFAVSLGEFGATLLLRRQAFSTVPIAIFESLGRPGPENLGRALAMATILLVVTTVSFLIIERFRYREMAPF